jgi:hypothetical protein
MRTKRWARSLRANVLDATERLMRMVTAPDTDTSMKKRSIPERGRLLGTDSGRSQARALLERREPSPER